MKELFNTATRAVDVIDVYLLLMFVKEALIIPAGAVEVVFI